MIRTPNNKFLPALCASSAGTPDRARAALLNRDRGCKCQQGIVSIRCCERNWQRTACVLATFVCMRCSRVRKCLRHLRRTKLGSESYCGRGRRIARRASEEIDDPSSFVPPAPRQGDYIDMFCRGTNGLFEQLVLPQIRERVQPQQAGSAPKDALGILTAAPEVPGISRPLWLVMLGSIPTALGWYGYYKFSVEEELFQEELRREGRATGCGGYGTLFPFVFALLLGFALRLAGYEDAGGYSIGAGSVWILLGQINLYRRVNEIVASQPTVNGGQPVLWEWWALLPPPIDVIVGVRQVHFLARAQAAAREEAWETDVVAEEWFPFIAAPRFTLLEFVSRPSMWFAFTKDVPDIDLVDAPKK